MPLTTYRFKNAANAFFEMTRDNAREILPKHLQPMEIRHGQGVFAVTAFDFTDSMVGPYTEIVLAVIVPPLVRPGDEMPKSAFYPFVVATSTKAARDHAIERWHLPHYMKDIAVEFDEADDRMSVRVHESERPIVDFTISHHTWTAAD
ncbi:MAG: acetoacetate decarboxylase family protein, partial [Candidatus Latescibacterota bacterium]